MITTPPQPVKLWGRGQLTIPKGIRRALRLDEETVLNVSVVGRQWAGGGRQLGVGQTTRRFRRKRAAMRR